MSKTKQKRFSSANEVFKYYFPKHTREEFEESISEERLRTVAVAVAQKLKVVL